MAHRLWQLYPGVERSQLAVGWDIPYVAYYEKTRRIIGENMGKALMTGEELVNPKVFIFQFRCCGGDFVRLVTSGILSEVSI